MNERDNKLSAFMDGELRDSDAYLDRLARDSEMRATWQRYHLARDAMKGQLSSEPLLDISAKVSHALQQEATIITPIWRRISPRYVMKQTAGLAVAAAVSTIAVLGVQQMQLTEQGHPALAQNSAQPAQQVQVAQNTTKIRQVAFTTRQKLDADVESKLSGYLVNHNEFSNSLRVSGVMPYTRIVSFVPESASQQAQNDK